MRATVKLPTPPPAYRSIKEVPIGAFAKIVGTDAVGLRTYDGFVSLTNPQSTWGMAGGIDLELLPKGTTVTLTSDV